MYIIIVAATKASDSKFKLQMKLTKSEVGASQT